MDGNFKVTLPREYFFAEKRKLLGTALYLLGNLWEKVTSDEIRDGIRYGKVWDGRPIKISRLAEDLGMTPRNVKIGINKLVKAKEINRKHSYYGLIIEVINCSKFEYKRCKTFPRKVKNISPLVEKNFTPSIRHINNNINKDTHKDLRVCSEVLKTKTNGRYTYKELKKFLSAKFNQYSPDKVLNHCENLTPDIKNPLAWLTAALKNDYPTDQTQQKDLAEKKLNDERHNKRMKNIEKEKKKLYNESLLKDRTGTDPRYFNYNN